QIIPLQVLVVRQTRCLPRSRNYPATPPPATRPRRVAHCLLMASRPPGDGGSMDARAEHDQSHPEEPAVCHLLPGSARDGGSDCPPWPECYVLSRGRMRCVTQAATEASLWSPE